MKFNRILMLTITILFFYPFIKSYSAGLELDIESNQLLFNITEFAPGDWTFEEIVVSNQYSENIYYNFDANFISGSVDLFNELVLNVVDSRERLIFRGNISEFNEVNNRYLRKNEKENLKFLVELPWELGNEYQGTSTYFTFIFSAEIANGNPPSCEEDPNQQGCEEPPVDNPTNPEDPTNPSESGKDEIDPAIVPKITNSLLPDTATNIYNLLLIGGLLFGSGSALILIHVRKIRRNL